MPTETLLQIDEIDSEMIDYMMKNGKVNAGELAELVGITVPSIRYRLFQLMAYGLVSQEKTRDRHVWFFVNDGGTDNEVRG
jgi:predicted transcriptional regulator